MCLEYKIVLLGADRKPNAAAGRFPEATLVAFCAEADGDIVALLPATARLSAAAGRFFAGGLEEELAVGSVPLSPSSPPPALRFFATPPCNGVVSQIVKVACAGIAN